jgi:glycosyltransferase involved in cell wall biosynthesis
VHAVDSTLTDDQASQAQTGEARERILPRQPSVSVVVPTRRRVRGLERLLAALERQSLSKNQFEVVLVDDGSGAELADEIDRLADGTALAVRVLHHSESKGQAKSRNAGWTTAEADIIAFTDDDCVPDSAWLERGLAAFDAAGVGVVQGRTVRLEDDPNYRYTPFTVVREVLQPSAWFEGCNVFYRREALEQSGGFDEAATNYGEDTNLGWDVLERGWERRWAEEATVEHEVGERPWSWHIWFHWRESNAVSVAARHPDIRAFFWRPWAVKRENALFAAAVGGLLLSLKKPLAVVLAGPYLAWLGPGRKVGAAGTALQVSAHAASLAGKLRACAKERTLLL